MPFPFKDVAERLIVITLAMYFIYLLYKISLLGGEGFLLSMSDLPDTAASIKIFYEYGFFKKVPYFSLGEYELFGSLPPLTPILGGIVHFFLRDYLLSAEMLIIVANLIIAHILLFQLGKETAPFIKVVFTGLFLCSYLAGVAFPFGYRIRQTVAMAFMLLAYIRQSYFFLPFLAFLSQPVSALLFSLPWGVKLIRERKFSALFYLIFAFLLSLPLYYKLVFASLQKPKYVGCTIGTTHFHIFLIPFLISYFPYLYFFSRYNWEEKIALFLFLSFPLFWLIFVLSPPLYYALLTSLPISSDLCSAFSPAMLFLSASVIKKNPEINGKISFLFSISFFLAVISSLASIGEESPSSWMDNLPSPLITWSDYYIDFPPYHVPVHPLFYIQSYAFLKGENVTFIDTPLPPQLNKGEYFVKLSDFSLCLWKGERCNFPFRYNESLLLYVDSYPSNDIARERIMAAARRNSYFAYNISRDIILIRPKEKGKN